MPSSIQAGVVYNVRLRLQYNRCTEARVKHFIKQIDCIVHRPVVCHCEAHWSIQTIDQFQNITFALGQIVDVRMFYCDPKQPGICESTERPMCMSWLNLPSGPADDCLSFPSLNLSVLFRQFACVHWYHDHYQNPFRVWMCLSFPWAKRCDHIKRRWLLGCFLSGNSSRWRHHFCPSRPAVKTR